ncbi:MAG: hypothetical protein MZV63_18005 [Marinilabiliales bacterium]|nr:hypothetical protein [Marinilabiliales bacterium]
MRSGADEAAIAELAQSITHNSTSCSLLVVVGEFNSGKSAFINAPDRPPAARRGRDADDGRHQRAHLRPGRIGRGAPRADPAAHGAGRPSPGHPRRRHAGDQRRDPGARGADDALRAEGGPGPVCDLHRSALQRVRAAVPRGDQVVGQEGGRRHQQAGSRRPRRGPRDDPAVRGRQRRAGARRGLRRSSAVSARAAMRAKPGPTGRQRVRAAGRVHPGDAQRGRPPPAEAAEPDRRGAPHRVGPRGWAPVDRAPSRKELLAADVAHARRRGTAAGAARARPRARTWRRRIASDRRRACSRWTGAARAFASNETVRLEDRIADAARPGRGCRSGSSARWWATRWRSHRAPGGRADRLARSTRTCGSGRR